MLIKPIERNTKVTIAIYHTDAAVSLNTYHAALNIRFRNGKEHVWSMDGPLYAHVLFNRGTPSGKRTQIIDTLIHVAFIQSHISVDIIKQEFRKIALIKEKSTGKSHSVAWVHKALETLVSLRAITAKECLDSFSKMTKTIGRLQIHPRS